jgi:hypothetical protein
MTTEALVTMLAAWGIVTFFTARFLVKALRTKRNDDE